MSVILVFRFGRFALFGCFGISFWLFRSFRLFRFGRFVLLFWVLVHAQFHTLFMPAASRLQVRRFDFVGDYCLLATNGLESSSNLDESTRIGCIARSLVL